MLKRCLAGALILVLVVTSLAVACAKPTPAPAPAPTPAPKPAPAPAPAPAPESPEEFFTKNKVSLINPFSIGGGVDFAARTVASHWSDVTGGTMIVQHKPGGGGGVGTAYVYESEPDGTTLLCGVFASAVGKTVFAEEPPKFDIAKMIWLASAMEEPYFW